MNKHNTILLIGLIVTSIHNIQAMCSKSQPQIIPQTPQIQLKENLPNFKRWENELHEIKQEIDPQYNSSRFTCITKSSRSHCEITYYDNERTNELVKHWGDLVTYKDKEHHSAIQILLAYNIPFPDQHNQAIKNNIKQNAEKAELAQRLAIQQCDPYKNKPWYKNPENKSQSFKDATRSSSCCVIC